MALVGSALGAGVIMRFMMFPCLEDIMFACSFMGNISGEATTRPGNIVTEAMRGRGRAYPDSFLASHTSESTQLTTQADRTFNASENVAVKNREHACRIDTRSVVGARLHRD